MASARRPVDHAANLARPALYALADFSQPHPSDFASELELELDTFDSEAWIAVVPFWMSGIRPRGFPAIPGLSRFPELNVRTYVRVQDKPGVYFFSLDAASSESGLGRTKNLKLPSFQGGREGGDRAGEIVYSSQRLDDAARFEGAVSTRSQRSIAVARAHSSTF